MARRSMCLVVMVERVEQQDGGCEGTASLLLVGCGWCSFCEKYNCQKDTKVHMQKNATAAL